MYKKMAILLGIFLFLLPVAVQSIQPEEKYTKIFLSPFYRASMSNNNNYNWSVAVNPPDGLTSILSAIVSFDVYLNPSVNFTIQANGIPCNTYFFYVSTTYASAGQSRITFDCSNVINKKGNFVITLRPSGANTGSITGWLDLTYKNNPNPDIFVSGTEYNIGEDATVFLQLLNSSNQPVNNALCYLKAYYPNKTIFINNSQMTYYIGSDGLYYYDLTVPNATGVYMLSANCNFYNNLTYSPAQQDTFVNSASNTTNYGNQTYFSIGRNGASTFYYGYVQFNTTNITSGGIKSVEIYLYQNLGLINTPVVTAQRVTSTWNESTVTWNTKPTNDAFVYDRQMVSQGWYKWNITNLMIGWLNGSFANYGVFFNITPSAGTLNYTSPASKESGGGYQPYILIQYETNEQINEIRGSGELHVSNTLLTAINSVNMTANQSLSILFELNQSVFNLSQAEFNHFQQILAYLQDINYTLNTTLEYKLDLINGTVMQINQTTFDTIQYLVGMNNSLTQYLVAINGTVHEINQSQYQYYLSILQAINSTNETQNWQYLNLLSLLNDINATGNATFELVASINDTLWNEIFVILKDINYTTNTTLEYKLDLINYTTWNSWVMLQNLTIGNVSVTANVNWTEGVPYIWNLSNPVKVQHDLLSLANQGIQLVSETYLCLADNVTLQTTMNVTNCIQGICDTYNRTATTICAWGCANNQCIPQPTIQYFTILGIVLLIAGISYIIWKSGGKG